MIEQIRLWDTEGFPVPTRRLPKKWHLLLQACYEMVIYMTMLEVTAAGMVAKANEGLPSDQAGRQFIHHQAAWFAHASTVAESANHLINLTIPVYVEHTKKSNETGKRYRQQVYDRVIKHIEGSRNSFVHPSRMYLASKITEDKLWEGSVALGLTPQKSLGLDAYPRLGEKAKAGEHDLYYVKTEEILGRIGLILQELEAEILLK